MPGETATDDHPLSGVIADIFAKEPEERTVYFCLDRELREQLSDAQQKLHTAKFRAGQNRSGDKDRDKDLAEEISDLQGKVDGLVEQAKGRLITFTFSAGDPQEYDRLKSEHRPTEAQKTEARKNDRDVPDWNTDTFPPQVVAWACTKVEGPSGATDGLSIETAQKMWRSPAYNDAERAMLCNAATGVQLTMTVIDLPKGV